MRYSFAKTPLKAAQAPLAAARANQEGDLKLILLLGGGGGGRGPWVGVKGERRGSVAASIGEVFSREGVVWWQGLGVRKMETIIYLSYNSMVSWSTQCALLVFGDYCLSMWISQK